MEQLEKILDNTWTFFATLLCLIAPYILGRTIILHFSGDIGKIPFVLMIVLSLIYWGIGAIILWLLVFSTLELIKIFYYPKRLRKLINLFKGIFLLIAWLSLIKKERKR